MSFAAPLVLLALLALPLLLLWYVQQQRVRRSAAAAFAAPRLQPSVAPRRPRWRRHLPMLAFALALALLVLAAARPQRTVAIPIERASIMLATDVSGSMLATDVQPNRLIAAKRAARSFVDRVPAGVNVGVLAFNTQATVLQSPTRSRADARAAIDRMAVSGGTATGEAIASALTALRNVPGEGGRHLPAAIVMISDGGSTSGRDPLATAREAASLHVPIYTVALGTDQGTIRVPDGNGGMRVVRVPPDPQSLAAIAHASGGEAFTAATTDGLSAVYGRLGSQLGHRAEHRQVTTAFAAGGLVLLLAGAGMSLRWFGRLI
ncbi:MAG TPA: VWA domain-containing protein [Conexibacter sp.]|jgi:Ca-activated chloride channel family protein|nr:VWA domain-containing protein [Conexibacter sp.]